MKYTETHEWVQIEGKQATVGVTQYAQKELGDVVYVELPKIGKSVEAGKEAAVLESTKAAADVYTPLSGIVLDVNQQLVQTPELINQAPEAGGWLFKIELSKPEEVNQLLDKASYDRLINGNEL